ncbi:MAG: HAD family phosphatase [Burkholderiales bacterium]|nr:HAD family phosphatase [Burkholderiales bacterium]
MSRRTPPVAVLFDMDGLLLDSERLAQRATQMTATALGHSIPEDVSLAMIGLGTDAVERLLVAELGSAYSPRIYQAAWTAHYGALVAEGVPPKPGALVALQALCDAGVGCAVATSTATSLARQKLERSGLLPYLQAVVGRDAVVHGKPAPDLYILAAQQLGTTATHCWAFEDSLPGLHAAVASGARTHWIPDIAPIKRSDVPPGVETVASLAEISRWLGAAVPPQR